MGWTIATIVLIIIVTILGFALYNLLKKNEALEDFISKQSEAVKRTLESKKKALKEIEAQKYKKKDVGAKEASDFLKDFSKGKK